LSEASTCYYSTGLIQVPTVYNHSKNRIISLITMTIDTSKLAGLTSTLSYFHGERHVMKGLL